MLKSRLRGGMRGNMKKVSIIVPAYNEEEVLEIFYKETKKVLEEITDKYDYELIFVNDSLLAGDRIMEETNLLQVRKEAEVNTSKCSAFKGDENSDFLKAHLLASHIQE